MNGEDKLANADLKVFNVIFNGVEPWEFKRISKCTTAQGEWIILETTHEGTTTVKQSEHQMLMTKFETLKMFDDESLYDIYVKTW